MAKTSKPTYSVLQDGGHYDDLDDLNTAINLAEELLGAVPQGEEATFTVENEDGKLLASATNRRIIGRFLKQQWGGRKNDDAIACGEEDFDATDAILLMDRKDLIELEDGSESTDRIGQDHISWHGPCEVTLTDSICEFFGVSSVEEITDEALAYARNRLNPQPADTQTVTLTLKVKIRVAPGTSVSEFIENLDYSVISNTVGITVQNTEIVDCD